MSKPLPKLKPYLKKLDYSYCFGAYPVLDLLKYKPNTILEIVVNPEGLNSEGISEIVDKANQLEIPVLESLPIIEKLSHKDNTYVIAVFEKYSSELNDSKPHLVLDQPRNLGNIGTIIRTMVGFGINELAIIRPAGDIFDPKVVRSAMGALFQINFNYFDSFEEYSKKHPPTNDRVYYPLMLDGSLKLNDVTFSKNASIIMGNESKGLDKGFSRVGQSIHISHSDQIDSLNLSIATSIVLYEFSQQNS